MPSLPLVMAGGAIGAGARFLVARALPPGSAWPWPTFAVNLAGGLLMGLLAGVLARAASEPARLFLGVGILGGFTTFSAFSLETATMIGRGALASAAIYALASVIGSVAALFAGLVLARVAA